MNPLGVIESMAVVSASAIGAFAVVFGVNAWKREYTGKRKLELMEDVLALFYEARDAIRYIRNPWSPAGEVISRVASPTESPEQKDINDRAYIVFERYNKRQELFNRLHAMRYRYMAQFGQTAALPFDELDKIVRDIFASAQVLAILWLDQGRRQWRNEEERQAHLSQMKEHQQVFWEMTPDRDPISPRLSRAISDIEAEANKILPKRNRQ